MKPAATRYILRREHLGRVSIRREIPPTRAQFPVDPRYDLRNHSPDGFEFGYAGSGPSQAALAVLADYLEDDELAVRYYQDFRRHFLEDIRGDLLVIECEKISRWSKWKDIPCE